MIILLRKKIYIIIHQFLRGGLSHWLSMMNHYRFIKCLGRGASGFTLVELIAVLVVVGILAFAVSIGVQSALASFRLNAASAKILSDIRYAQHQARARNGWYGVRFQANPTNRYNVYFTNGVSDIDLLDPAEPSAVLDVDVAARFGGTLITAVAIAAGNKVEFNPIGTPYDDKNGSPLGSDGTVTISQGGSARTIRIVKNTGMVELQ